MIVIVGAGILGLSLAAHLSQDADVCVVDDERPFQGSQAAAANIATKAQLFGRDPHFALKIQAQHHYERWLSDFFDTQDFEKFFRKAPALELFDSPAQCETQLKRILQPETDLRARGFGPNPVTRLDSVTLQYTDEIWVDARVLCQRIRSYCRSVRFINHNITSVGFFTQDLQKVERVILACGAWTSDILMLLGFENLPAIRLSAGCVVSLPISHGDGNTGIIERHKIVESGGPLRKYFSSTMMKSEKVLASPILNESWIKIQRDFEQKIGLREHESEIERHVGWRMGYGHSEIKVMNLGFRSGIRFDLCAGAHRSGFAFAPMVGKLLQNLQG